MRVLGGEGAPRIAEEAGGGGDEMRGHGELWRLEAPGSDKLGMDQHLELAARRSHRETAGYSKNCITIWAVTLAWEAAFEATRR